MMPKQPQKPETRQTQSQSQDLMSPRKVYSREFKLETLRLLKSSGKTKVELEQELGLYPGQIRLWERAFNREEGDVQQAFQAQATRAMQKPK